MITLHISCAQAHNDGSLVEPLTLIADRPVPETPDPYIPGTGFLSRLRAYYRAEAEQLEAALIQSIPGGLYDQLLAAMLLRKASLFAVPHERAVFTAVADSETPRERYLRTMLERTGDEFNAYVTQAARLERDLCGDSDRSGHGPACITLWDHIRAHQGYHLRPDLEDGAAVPHGRAEWEECLRWLHEFRKRVADEVAEVFPAQQPNISVTLHESVTPDALHAAHDLGFVVSANEASQSDAALAWLESPQPGVNGSVTLFTHRGDLRKAQISLEDENGNQP